MLFCLCGVCSAVLTVTLAAWPPFAPAHSAPDPPSSPLGLGVSRCLWVLFLPFIQPESVSTVCRQENHARLLLVSADGQDSPQRGLPWPQGGVACHSPDNTRVFPHCPYHILPAACVYVPLSGSPLGWERHEAMTHCVLVSAEQSLTHSRCSRWL